MCDRLTNVFLSLFCEKNSDGTRNLRLKGKDMYQRIGLEAFNMYRVSIFLKERPEIIKLDLCYNDIGDDGVEILVKDYLSEENTLEHLNLMSCSIGPLGMKYLCEASDTLVLKTLRVNGNELGTDGGRFVAMLLSTSTTLKLLDVGDSNQTLASMAYLTTVIREDVGTNKSLTVLDISRVIPNSKLYQYSTGHLAESIGDMLKVNSSLIELHAQKNEFLGHDVELMLIGMSKNTTLLLLDLGYNNMGDHGIELLSKWLRDRPSLLGLNVAGNKIKDTGARALSFALPFSKVRLLDITFNHITDIGMLDILNTIKKPYMLRLFFFWGNQFGHETNQILERMLLAKVLNPETIDIRLYTVDKIIHHAFYQGDHYKQRYYCVMDYGCPVELRIKKIKLEVPGAQPRGLVKFEYNSRFPAVDPNIPPKTPPCT